MQIHAGVETIATTASCSLKVCMHMGENTLQEDHVYTSHTLHTERGNLMTQHMIQCILLTIKETAFKKCSTNQGLIFTQVDRYENINCYTLYIT